MDNYPLLTFSLSFFIPYRTITSHFSIPSHLFFSQWKTSNLFILPSYRRLEDCLSVLFWFIFSTKSMFSVCLVTHAFLISINGAPRWAGKGAQRKQRIIETWTGALWVLLLLGLNPTKLLRALPERGLQSSNWRNSAFFSASGCSVSLTSFSSFLSFRVNFSPRFIFAFHLSFGSLLRSCLSPRSPSPAYSTAPLWPFTTSWKPTLFPT